MRLYNIKKEKPIKIRRKWKINPKSKIKESDKLYNRKEIKLEIKKQQWREE